ncbi:hypothetical protein [Mycolicibacter heraklionensis]|uniref:hypothetical protein n=1 Tax=Mycolicibacter heraklionensis TaxID=512402 RepID=UPI0007EC1EB4|nr:hypothetical protein [Mycolicibacter heraklionensis]OBG36203.1 hypothetical protein A5671_21745 [Mycolicibacter heraklionensis]
MTDGALNYTPIDALRHVGAFLNFAVNQMHYARDNPPEGWTDAQTIELAIKRLSTAAEDCVSHLDDFGEAGTVTYSTGHEAISVVSPTARNDFVWCWHPDPQHPSNQPRLLASDVDLGDGEWVDILIAAPGHLDVVRRDVPAGGGDDALPG